MPCNAKMLSKVNFRPFRKTSVKNVYREFCTELTSGNNLYRGRIARQNNHKDKFAKNMKLTENSNQTSKITTTGRWDMGASI